jgi:hypothetical protein
MSALDALAKLQESRQKKDGKPGEIKISDYDREHRAKVDADKVQS